MARALVSVVFALSVAAGLACAGSNSGPARCPGEGWCGSAQEAERMAEAAAGSTLTCPIHIESAYASRSAAPAAPAEGAEGEGQLAEAAPAPAGLPAGVPDGAHGTLDEKRTRKLRADGDADTCCYTWVTPCPG